MFIARLSGKSRSRWITAILLYAASVVAFAPDSAERWEADAATAQPSGNMNVARTGSPRKTLQSWLDLAREAEILTQQYMQHPTHAKGYRNAVHADLLLDPLDLSETPVALRNDAGFKATYALADITARVELPPMDSVPDWDPFDESAPGTWCISGMPITIARIDEGRRSVEASGD